MKTLLVVMMLVSCSVLADGDRIYERYGYGNPYRDWETDRKSTRLNSSHITRSRMPSSA